MTLNAGASVEDLYRVPDNGKAELVNGELVLMSPTGARPGRASFKIAASLDQHGQEHGGGTALPANVGFLVDLPNRQSFSPGAAWYLGEVGEQELEFLSGAPAFAAEVRSKDGYGPAAERAIQEKVRDYFAAGTRVVWDVDLRSVDVVRGYRSTSPGQPTLYRRGDRAEAEPAVPGWSMAVDELFR